MYLQSSCQPPGFAQCWCFLLCAVASPKTRTGPGSAQSCASLTAAPKILSGWPKRCLETSSKTPSSWSAVPLPCCPAWVTVPSELKGNKSIWFKSFLELLHRAAKTGPGLSPLQCLYYKEESKSNIHLGKLKFSGQPTSLPFYPCCLEREGGSRWSWNRCISENARVWTRSFNEKTSYPV